ncbi:MAG: hypothetical protein BGO12_21125 [Verrucomicrobia bacterium 61-8]|nr:hypothetical protein [Verrucomicrobiota bacterium]OJV06174.1 MAG: hypothetical protein BGO12_21125 [Verrucomicrobia bacterium 61-8]
MALDHPNSHLSKDIVERGLDAAAGAFRRCGINPLTIPESQFGCNSLLYGEFGGFYAVVYVRITVGGEEESGTGPVPEVLNEAASDLFAEPYVIRVHIDEAGHVPKLTYFGYDEFIEDVSAEVAENNADLIEPRTFSDYQRMLKGHVSELLVEVDYEECGSGGTLAELRLKVDGRVPFAGTIDAAALLRSTTVGCEYNIFTCSCGYAGCAGIDHGVRVFHDDELILWKAYYAKGRKVFLFNKNQYRAEILKKCGEVIRFAQSGESHYVSPFNRQFAYLRKSYQMASL